MLHTMTRATKKVGRPKGPTKPGTEGLHHVRTAISPAAEDALLKLQARLLLDTGQKLTLPEITRDLLEKALLTPIA